MTKIIKGHITSSNIVTMNRRERLENYLGQFSVYFETAGNNLISLPIADKTNMVAIFSSVDKISTPCSGCQNSETMEFENTFNFQVEDPIWEFMHFTSITPTFFRIEESKFERRMCPNSKLITINTNGEKLVVGEFCPSKKFLLTSDWTHSDNTHEFVQAFLERMEAAGLISRRNISKKQVKVTLGTDPEFELVADSGEILNCSDDGIIDRVLMPNGQGRIGKDGSGAQREIRPEPSDTPEGLVANIDKLIDAATDEKWSLRGERFSLGGHIHIGGIEESIDYINILDYFLEPLSEFNSNARKNSRYGKPGDWRPQPYGVEYRTPPPAWLATKRLAVVTLKIVKLAAEKHFSTEDVTIGNSLPNDLVALGLTDEEVNIYFSEINNLKEQGLPDDLRVAWGHKIMPKFTIEIRDGWSDEVKRYVSELARNIIIEENFNGKFIFYGLNTSRGRVISVDIRLRNKVNMPTGYEIVGPVKTSAGKYGIGIPSDIRGNLTEAKACESALKQIIGGLINPSKYLPKTITATVVHEPVEDYIAVDLPTRHTPTTGYGSGYIHE